MNFNTQNAKIASTTEKTLIVSIDVDSETRHTRAFDWRNYEYSKKPLEFSNTEAGFMTLKTWVEDIAGKHGETVVIPGVEPTGHYWFALGKFLQDNEMKPVRVNPHHIKKSKELDDNNPNKSDHRDPETIAALVSEGRFFYPYIPTGIYAEIRSLSNLRSQTQEELAGIRNRVARWFIIYFPEYKDVYGDLKAVSGGMVPKIVPLPEDIRKLGVNGMDKIWRDAKLKGVEMKRVKTLVSAAEHNVGSKEAPEIARFELKSLLDDMDICTLRLEELLRKLEEKLKETPYIDKLMKIKGIGVITASGFIAEVGNIGCFNKSKQLQELAGYAIIANDSGKHNRESRIGYRDGKHSKYVLYEVIIPLVGRNAGFKAIYEYYRTRKENPLKRMQSAVVVACKILRVFYTILTKGVDYDPVKLMGDTKRPRLQAA